MPKKPVVASYIADFLKRDMVHVFRQLHGLQEVEPHVFTHNRENEDTFPWQEKRLTILKKPRSRWLRRLVYKQILQQPWQMYRAELRQWILDLTRLDAKVLHIYFGHIAPQFIPLMKAWPHSVIVSFHGADAGVDMDRPKHRAAMQEVYQHASCILCRSESLKRDLIELSCPEEKIRIWRTGVKVDAFPAKERPTPTDGAWKIMQACRFIDKKGLDLTLAAFATVRQKFPNAQLLLLGDGPLQADLAAQAKSLNIDDAVEFGGFRRPTDVRKALYESHLFVHPSRTTADGNREGIPNAAIEAMATGMPVIGTTHGGFPEAIADGDSGLLVPENDAPALAAAMLRVLEDHDLRQQLSAGGRRAVEEKFDVSVQVSLLEDCYKSLMSPPYLEQ